ncbi:MAG TPA: hypothetical protein VE397_22205 [Stellaceae bacterium]|nr:hypothetical protein [Stellaceae bacterium]
MALTLILAGCSAVPPSLGPTVRESAVDYSKAMDQFSDRALLTNVLRARDYLPLNFSDLSSITGSFALQGSLGLSLPLQNFPHGLGYGTATTAIAASSSPILTLGSLDTQGFIMTMIQPVSPMYVVGKWNDGYDRAMLMFLFMKSVKFADGRSYLNNPDDPAAMAGFNRLVAEMTAADAELKPLTLLEPVGPPFSLLTAKPDEAAKGHSGDTPASDESVDLASLNLVKSIDGGALRVGNAPCAGGGLGCVQLYKEYPAQVALCVDAAFDPARDAYTLGDHVIFSGGAAGQPPMAGRALMQARLKSRGAEAGAGGSPPRIASAGDVPDVTVSSEPRRISVILDSEDCKPDEIVLGPETEQSFSAASGKFAQIEWRSVSEAIRYLGAVVRNEESPHVPTWRDAPSGPEQTLIRVVDDDAGPIAVDYLGRAYSVPAEERAGRRPGEAADHGLRALSMLNELIGTAKISGNLPVSQPVQFIVP